MTETTPSDGTWLSDRALIRVGGDEARDFLQGLVTQDMKLVAPGVPRWAGLLTPQGKALFDFILWNQDGELLIDCEADQREALIRRLSIYRLRRPVTIEAVDGAVHWSLSGTEGAPDPRLPELGHRWLSGARGEPAQAWIKHRLALGVTEGGAELGQDKTLWLEGNADALNGVSFNKGCYVGQENTARMHYRAKVNRRLVVAPLGEPGDRTRAAYPELGLMVELRRVDALGDAVRPAWLEEAVSLAQA